MFVTFALLVAAGVSFQLASSWALRKRFDLRLTLLEVLAVVLLVLAGLPDWLSPIPLPFSFMLGVALSDLLTRRVAT